MTTTPTNTGWLATLRGYLPGASTAAGPAATSPDRELSTVATETKPEPRGSIWNWWSGEATSPTAGTQQDTAKDTSGLGQPQASGWFGAYNPLSRWLGTTLAAKPSTQATPAESNVTRIQFTELDDMLKKYEDAEEHARKRQEALTTLSTMSPEDRNRHYQSAHHMCDKGALTVFRYLNSQDLKDLGLDVDTSAQSTLGGRLKSAFKKAQPGELTTLQPTSQRRKKAVTFTDQSGPTAASPTVGTRALDKVKSYLSTNPTDATGSLVTFA